jgi:hypothetical protein
LGFAAIGLLMMSLAIGVAGVAAPASGVRVDAAARAIPNHRVELYQEPPEALTVAMPVP